MMTFRVRVEQTAAQNSGEWKGLFDGPKGEAGICTARQAGQTRELVHFIDGQRQPASDGNNVVQLRPDRRASHVPTDGVRPRRPSAARPAPMTWILLSDN